MRFLWFVLLALSLSACGDRERGSGDADGNVERDAGTVKPFITDEGYGDCLPKETRDDMLKMMDDIEVDDAPKLPRECGSSARDRAKIQVQECADEYDGSHREAAEAHAESCARRFPPPE